MCPSKQSENNESGLPLPDDETSSGESDQDNGRSSEDEEDIAPDDGSSSDHERTADEEGSSQADPGIGDAVPLIPQFIMERTSMPTDVRFHVEDDILVSSDMDGYVTLWELSDEKTSASVKFDLLPHRSPCRSVRFMKGGHTVVSVGKDKRICVITNGLISRTIKKAHEASIFSVHSIDANVLATGDDDGCIKIWDLRTETSTAQFHKSSDYISALSCDEEGKTLLATSGDGTLTAFNIRGRHLELQSEPFSSELLSVSIVKGGSKVVCGTGDGGLLIFKWGEWGFTLDQYPGGLAMSVDAVEEFTPDRVFTGNSDGNIRLINIMPYRMLGYVGHHSLPFERLTVSSGKDLLGSTSHDNSIRFWNVSKFLDVPDIDGDSDSSDDSDADAKRKPEGKRKNRSTKMPKRVKTGCNDFFSDL